MTGQAKIPNKSRADVSVHGFWKWGTTSLVDMRIVYLDAGLYLHQTSEKALATVEKEKKDKYLHPCLERKCSFTTIIYSAYAIPRTEIVAAQWRLALLLRNKLKREYLEMCGFVRACLSLVIVSSNTLFLRGAREKEACIRHITILEDGAMIALLAPWQG